MNNSPELSLFALPKGFVGHTGVIQSNAILSWTHLRPRCDITLFGDEEGTATFAAEHNLRHVPEVARTEAGTPLVDDLFQRVLSTCSHQLLCYVNADIILPSSFTAAVARVMAFRPRFLMVGRPVDLDVTEPLLFDDGWEDKLLEQARRDGRLRPPWGSDFFVYPRDLWREIPPFAIGRTVWDNWLIGEARRRAAAVIDATEEVYCIHQNHDFGSLGDLSGKKNSPEARQNVAIYARSSGHDYRFSLKDVTHQLTPRGIRASRMGPPRFRLWQMSRTPPFSFVLGPLRRLLGR